MSGLDSESGVIANAVLNGLAIVPLAAIWAYSLRSVRHHSEPVKMSQAFLRVAVPVLMLSAVLLTATAAVGASVTAAKRVGTQAFRAAVYLELTGHFIGYAAAILGTVSLYLAVFSAYYVTLGRLKWWSLIRLDAIVGAVFLFAFDVAWYAKNMSDIARARSSIVTSSLNWFPIIIDITLVVLACVIFGFAIHVYSPLKKRADLPLGHISGLLLTASILWLFRCTYVLAVDIKNIIPDWTYEEQVNQLVIWPILNLWVTVAALALIANILRKPLWSDPAAIPDGPLNQPPPQAYYPHPQQQPQVNQYQQYQQPPMQYQHATHYPQYQQQPVQYQQPPQQQQGHPIYEAGGVVR